jgi:hypothetical protein
MLRKPFEPIPQKFQAGERYFSAAAGGAATEHLSSKMMGRIK